MSRPRSFTEEERATWVPVAALLELLPRQLDAQLLRDDKLTHFDYFTLSMLAVSQDHTQRMSALASMANATLPRLSHVISRLERRGYVRRSPTPGDARGTDVTLTNDGRRKVIGATPAHVENVRHYVLDALSPEQFGQLRAILRAILARLDPERKTMATHRR